VIGCILPTTVELMTTLRCGLENWGCRAVYGTNINWLYHDL